MPSLFGGSSSSSSTDSVPFQKKDNRKYAAHTLTTHGGGIGVLNGFITTVGSFTYGFDDVYGSHAIFTTGTTDGNGAGWRSSSTLTRTIRNPVLYGVFSLSQTTLFELFIGFHAILAFPTGADPLNTLHGCGLTATGSGNFRLATNDGSGATAFSELVPTKAVDTDIHTFELAVTDNGATVTLSLDGGTNVKTTLSNLPTPGQGVGGGAYIETSTNAAKSMNLFRWEGLF